MAKLHVEASTRWAGGGSDFRDKPIMVVLSVTDDAGAPFTGVVAGNIFTRYLQSPDGGSIATFEVAFVEHHTGHPTAEGFYSFVVRPSEEIHPSGWVQDQVFLFISIRRAGNFGQAICLATYHQSLGPPFT